MAAAVLGSVIACVVVRGGWIWLLLWTPLPFYALSIAYGSVPIFVPEWWPHSYYNVRYGMELIPIFCVSVAFLASLGKRAMLPGRWQVAFPIVVLAGTPFKMLMPRSTHFEIVRRLHTAVPGPLRIRALDPR